MDVIRKMGKENELKKENGTEKIEKMGKEN